MNYIVDQPQFWSDNDADILASIKKGFVDCHLAMWRDLGEDFYVDCFYFDLNPMGKREI